MVQHDMPPLPDPTEHQKMAPRVSITAGGDNRRQSLLFGSTHPSQRELQGAGGRRPSLFRDENESMRSLSSQGGKRPGRAARASRRISTVVLRVKDAFKKRNVKMDEKKNQIRFIEQLDELEEDLIKLVWFTVDEIDDMKHENEMTAAAFDAGHADVDARGLENKTEEGNWNAYKARKDVVNALLDEQDEQQAQRFAKLDWEKLRNVCVEFSERLQQEAWERARSDESVVEDYLASTKREWIQLKEAIEKAKLNCKQAQVENAMEVEAAPSSPAPKKKFAGRRVSLIRAGSKRKNSLTTETSEPPHSRARRVSVFGRKPAGNASSNGNQGVRPPPESPKIRGRFSVLSRKQPIFEDPSDNTGSGRDDVPLSPGSKKGNRRISFFGGRGSMNKTPSQLNLTPLSPMDLDESDVDEDLDATMELKVAVPPPPVASGRKARKASWFLKASARFENPSSSFTSAA